MVFPYDLVYKTKSHMSIFRRRKNNNDTETLHVIFIVVRKFGMDGSHAHDIFTNIRAFPRAFQKFIL
jgi:hypothetical protein